MKFPYELSELRISLLSKEDLRIYRFEHSDFFDVSERQRCMQEYQNALLERQGYYVQEIKKDPLFNYLNESLIVETANELTLYEVSLIVDLLGDFVEEAVLSGIYTEDEAVEYVNEFANNFKTMSAHSLNERAGDTIGPDMTWWAEGIGGIFLGAFSIVIMFLMHGKTKLAIKMLENSMNEIVERIDDGLNKKKGRGLWNRIKTRVGSWFGKDTSGENEGEQNTTCFRVIQEEFLSNIAAKCMVLCKNIGFLPETWDEAETCLKQRNWTAGGFSEFENKIAKPVNLLSGRISKV